MDNRPIGIFDSGLGGLTAAKALEALLPGESLVYFGDSANAPYGPRSREELLSLARANAAFLLESGVKAILVACGTVSSTVVGEIRAESPVPLFDVVGPACAEAARRGARRVAVAATEATIRSGAFERRLRELSPGAELLGRACPTLVPTVERGHFRPGDPDAEAAVAAEFGPVRDWKPDAVLLACTHFPLLEASIAAFLGPEACLISVSAEAAKALARTLSERGLLSGAARGTSRWFTSGVPERFAALAEMILGHSIRPEVHHNACPPREGDTKYGKT